MIETPTFSVSEVNAYVKGVLDQDILLRNLRIRGEVSNYKRHSSGHIYFSLKDATARISCVLFRQNAYGLQTPLHNGLSVVAEGRAALYERDGQYQFYVERVQPDGVGALYALLEKTKQRLRALGYFDPEIKKPLPADPKTIGVVTSPTGAVIRDIVHVARRRNPSVNILLCPARVQGEGAAEEIAAALDRLSRENVDVILCGRGGGSLEDLWAFNEEAVARAIHRCPVPVISCVGHETDYTIADLTADVRAATPSQAAELAVPDVSGRRLLLDELTQRLELRCRRKLETEERRLQELTGRIDPQRGLRDLMEESENVGDLNRRLESAARRIALASKERYEGLWLRLRALDPEAALKRGYAYAKRGDAFVSAAKDLHVGEPLALRFCDGEAGVRVETLTLNDEVQRSDEDEREKADI